MAQTSKLTKDKPKATVTYPDDVKGPVTVKVTGGEEEPFTKKLSFDDGGSGGDGGSGDGGGDGGSGDGGGEQPTGDIEATVEQDQKDPRKVTVTVTKVPQDSGSGSGSGSGEEGAPTNGGAGSEGGTQGTGASSADRTSPQARAGESGSDTGSGSSSGESKPLTIEWGGKTTGEAPTEIEKDKPVTVTYDKSVEKATITIDDDDEKTEPFTKGLKFGAPPEETGDIVVDAVQDEANPRKITFTLKKAPGQDSGGASGGDSGSGSGSGSGSESGSGQQSSGGQQA